MIGIYTVSLALLEVFMTLHQESLSLKSLFSFQQAPHLRAWL